MAESVLRCRDALTPAGWTGPVAIHWDGQGTITQVDPLNGATVGGGCVVPGMANLHSHSFQRAMAGRTEQGTGDPDSFWTWRERMYEIAGRLGPAEMEAVTAWVQMEMLEAGYTSCGEFHYLHHQPDGRPYDDPAEMSLRVLTAAETSGIALTLLPVLYCRAGFDGAELQDRQRRFAHEPEGFLALVERCRAAVGDDSRHRIGMAPHSLRAVGQEELHAVLSGRPEGVPVHIHISEQRAEVAECVAVRGARPVEWLLGECDVGPDWCLVHATHLVSTERRAAAASGAVAGLCPTTEADLGDGIFDTRAWIDADGRFGIGSDSNLRICPAEELRSLEFQARLASERRIVLADDAGRVGRPLWDAAARDGARALAQPAGAIAPGNRADLVELDPLHPFLEGRSADTVLDTWLFAGDRSMVRSVHVAGRSWVEGGRHLRRTELERPFRAALEKLS